VQLLAPDACLDRGGSFNYSIWKCSYDESFPYIPTSFLQLDSFWLMVVSVVASTIALRLYSNKNKSNAF
jgi:hypothetical protein